MPNFDAIIIGTGQAGPSLARRLAQAGQKVAVIERKLFGGTCVNTGCTPTKTMVASAYAAHLARRGAEFGVEIAGAIKVDMAKVKARKDGVVALSTTAVERQSAEPSPIARSIRAMAASSRRGRSRSAPMCWARRRSSSMSAAGPRGRRSPGWIR